jgi:DNA replication ATP-dependent helicase Dna2
VEIHGEAIIAMTLVEMARSAGIPEEAMAIISPYRSQVSHLIDKVRSKNLGVECLTIDKAQGKDKDMVIVSLVRSNDTRAPGKLLDDARRVNVAITRAKSKLVLIGDSSTLKNLTLFDTILTFLSHQGWVHGIAQVPSHP